MALDPRWFAVLILCFSLLACGGAREGDETSALVNSFTKPGQPLQISDIAQGTERYYGRALIKNGGTVYGASIRFDLKSASDSTAYFSNFQITRLVTLNGFGAAAAVVTSPLTLGLPTSFQAGANELRINNASERYARFSLNFDANAYLSDIFNGGVMVSQDFATLVGGTSGHFFFIAQKNVVLPGVTIGDFNARFSLVDFSVSAAGQVNTGDFWNFTAAGTGGNGMTAYFATNATDEAIPVREGELKLIDNDTGVFIYGEDSTPGDGPATADDLVIDGGFLFAPDRQLLLGYNLSTGEFWAGSRQ